MEISYFGTLNIELNRGNGGNRDAPRLEKLGKQFVDEHVPDMAAFVAQNHALAKRRYYNVLRGAFFEAPPARQASSPISPASAP